MATAKTAAKPAAKTAAPAKKAPAPAAKKAAAPAPAPAAEEATVEYAVGNVVKFLGYGDDVPENERFLEADTEYEVVGITEADEHGPGGELLISIPNPNFDSKKKVSDANPETVEVPVFPEEVEFVAEAYEEEEEGAEEGAAEAAAEEQVTDVVEKPKAAAKPAAKTAAAKPAAKTAAAKPAAKTAPAKKTAKAKEAPAEEQEADDGLPDLENEDAQVLALVEGSEDLIATAQELESQAASAEYQLGGVLYHIKKNKTHETMEGGEVYAQPGGFQKFLQEFFNIEYRKAMYLIDIYVKFTLAGIENPAEHVAAIGWTKASKITKTLTAENAAELVELAQNNTVVDLVKAIEEQTVEVGGKRTAGEKKVRITMRFRFFEEEGKLNQETLEAVKDANGFKDIEQALTHVLAEYRTNNGGEAAVEKAPAQKTATTAKAGARPAVKRAAVAAK